MGPKGPNMEANGSGRVLGVASRRASARTSHASDIHAAIRELGALRGGGVLLATLPHSVYRFYRLTGRGNSAKAVKRVDASNKVAM